MRIITDHALYQVASLELQGCHTDRKFVANIDRGGNVHLNILGPGARAGNHYHERIEEFFINPGPGKLLLHVKDSLSGRIETLEMTPISRDEVRAYRPKLGVSHVVENPGPERITLIIVVDKDDPSDVIPDPLFPLA